MSSQAINTVPIGSVFLNNTTYTGCDIKVLINLYDNNQTINEQAKNIAKDMTDEEKKISDQEKYVADLEEALGSVKPGTKEEQSFRSSLSREQNILSTMQASYSATFLEKAKKENKSSNTPSTKVLAECQTLSLSVFRDKRAVRSCGSTYAKAYTRGPREIAGSLIFTVFDQHVVWDLLQAHPSDFDGNTATGAIIDQLPPVDIIVTFANEYGSMSRMTIYGVEFISEGQTMSIEDLITENAVNFVARDYDPMRLIGSKVKMDDTSARLQQDFVGAQKASSLINEDDYQNFQKDSPYDRFLRRRNPFI